jgi:hypothetical protein
MHPVANRQRNGSAYASFPLGISQGASTMAVSYGGMACRMVGVHGMTAAIGGVGDMAAALVGANAMAVSATGMTALRDMICAMQGTNTLSAALRAYGDMRCAMVVNQLTEGDVQGAVLDTEIEPGLSVREVLRLLLAVAAGKTDIVPGAGASATVRFRDPADTTDRVVATMAGSERVAVTLDPD